MCRRQKKKKKSRPQGGWMDAVAVRFGEQEKSYFGRQRDWLVGFVERTAGVLRFPGWVFDKWSPSKQGLLLPSRGLVAKAASRRRDMRSCDGLNGLLKVRVQLQRTVCSCKSEVCIHSGGTSRAAGDGTVNQLPACQPATESRKSLPTPPFRISTSVSRLSLTQCRRRDREGDPGSSQTSNRPWNFLSFCLLSPPLRLSPTFSKPPSLSTTPNFRGGSDYQLAVQWDER